MTGKDDALTEQLNLRVSPADVRALKELSSKVIKPGTVARIAMRLGLERIKSEGRKILMDAAESEPTDQ